MIITYKITQKDWIMKFAWDHFNYHVTDVNRSVEFYKKTLGMKVIREMGIIHQQMGDHGCFIKDPDGYLIEILKK